MLEGHIFILCVFAIGLAHGLITGHFGNFAGVLHSFLILDYIVLRGLIEVTCSAIED